MRQSLTTADDCMPPPVLNFVTILNYALHLYEQKCPKVHAKFINGLIQLVKSHVDSLPPGKCEREGVYCVSASFVMKEWLPWESLLVT